MNWRVRFNSQTTSSTMQLFGSNQRRPLNRLIQCRLNFELRFPNDSESIGSLAPISR